MTTLPVRPSTKVQYGLAALFDLAYHGGGAGRAAQAREIAARQEVPLRYLEQILQDLRRAGLVEAKRGPGGGYALARAPEVVRLSEILGALEGEASAGKGVGGKVNGTDDERRSGGGVDVAEALWREIAAKIEAVYAGVTLQDLVDRALALGVARAHPGPQMYFI
jgi:Rrf2 family protein